MFTFGSPNGGGVGVYNPSVIPNQVWTALNAAKAAYNAVTGENIPLAGTIPTTVEQDYTPIILLAVLLFFALALRR